MPPLVKIRSERDQMSAIERRIADFILDNAHLMRDYVHLLVLIPSVSGIAGGRAHRVWNRPAISPTWKIVFPTLREKDRAGSILSLSSSGLANALLVGPGNSASLDIHGRLRGGVSLGREYQRSVDHPPKKGPT